MCSDAAHRATKAASQRRARTARAYRDALSRSSAEGGSTTARGASARVRHLGLHVPAAQARQACPCRHFPGRAVFLWGRRAYCEHRAVHSQRRGWRGGAHLVDEGHRVRAEVGVERAASAEQTELRFRVSTRKGSARGRSAHHDDKTSATPSRSQTHGAARSAKSASGSAAASRVGPFRGGARRPRGRRRKTRSPYDSRW